MGPRRREPADHGSLAEHIAASGVSQRVVDAFKSVDRAEFVPEGTAEAYADHPIGILEHQTTSQPSLIAQMIDAADLLPGDNVLEVGTGFGFQTALLAQIAGHVVSIERFASISAVARDNLGRARISNVELVVGDGWEGVPGRAPYEAIIVSAAATHLPGALIDQLKEGGRLVIPVTENKSDDVWLYVRKDDRAIRVKLLTPARFVPLVPGDAVQSNE